MSTTTIRLPEDLKARVARAAKEARTTAHAYILEAITEKAGDDELRSAFHAVAAQRHEDFLADGKTIPWTEMRSYLEARAAGKPAARLRPRKLGGRG